MGIVCCSSVPFPPSRSSSSCHHHPTAASTPSPQAQDSKGNGNCNNPLPFKFLFSHHRLTPSEVQAANYNARRHITNCCKCAVSRILTRCSYTHDCRSTHPVYRRQHCYCPPLPKLLSLPQPPTARGPTRAD